MCSSDQRIKIQKYLNALKVFVFVFEIHPGYKYLYLHFVFHIFRVFVFVFKYFSKYLTPSLVHSKMLLVCSGSLVELLTWLVTGQPNNDGTGK